MIPPIEVRRELVGRRVTLDGRPAVIGGARNTFATVATLDGSVSGSWSWPAVTRVVASGGAFRS